MKTLIEKLGDALMFAIEIWCCAFFLRRVQCISILGSVGYQTVFCSKWTTTTLLEKRNTIHTRACEIPLWHMTSALIIQFRYISATWTSPKWTITEMVFPIVNVCSRSELFLPHQPTLLDNLDNMRWILCKSNAFNPLKCFCVFPIWWFIHNNMSFPVISTSTIDILSGELLILRYSCAIVPGTMCLVTLSSWRLR